VVCWVRAYSFSRGERDYPLDQDSQSISFSSCSVQLAAYTGLVISSRGGCFATFEKVIVRALSQAKSSVPMSWVTLFWSMDAAFCFTLAGMYLLVWWKQRKGWVHLLFSCGALAAGAIAGFELMSMRAETTVQYGALLRFISVQDDYGWRGVSAACGRWRWSSISFSHRILTSGKSRDCGTSHGGEERRSQRRSACRTRGLWSAN